MILVLDAKKMTSKEVLHDCLAELFRFPGWYGRNLDALYDCLGDVQEDVELCVLDKEKLVENLGNYGKAFCKVLKDVEKENLHLTIRGLE